MEHLRPGGVNRRPSPQLPAFCRTRRRVTTTVRLSTLQQLLWLLLLVVFLQLSTILLVLAGPAPAPLRPMAVPLVLPPNNPMAAAQLAAPGAMPPGAIAIRHSAPIPTVPSSFQP
ncbi:MAG: hypothetical protein NTV57_15240 [Cyanobacteria bacterium]|nr:hypothetical protein [Cyanobacteriota bacterium]